MDQIRSSNELENIKKEIHNKNCKINSKKYFEEILWLKCSYEKKKAWEVLSKHSSEEVRGKRENKSKKSKSKEIIKRKMYWNNKQ